MKIFAYVFSEGFAVLALLFRFDPLWVIFCIWHKVKIWFHSFCLCIYACPSTICWKDNSFPIELPWHSCPESIHHEYNDLFLNFQFYSVICIFTFTSVPHWLYYFSFVESFEISTCDSSNFVPPFQDHLC